MPPDRLEQLRTVAERELRTPNDTLRVPPCSLGITSLMGMTQSLNSWLLTES